MYRKRLRHIYILFLFLTVSFSKNLEAKPRYQYQVCICAIFRDDARFLKEWIEFHRVVGVEHFWLFNNLSQDNYLEVLTPYVEEGIVDLVEWPYESEDWHQWHEIQNTAYEACIRLAVGKTKWLAFIDSDEFLFPVKKKNLLAVLKHYEKYGGVCVNWQMYGTSGVKRIPDDKLMIELLTRKGETHLWKNYFIKSIVRPERVKCFPSSHYAYFFGNYYSVDTKKKRFVGNRSRNILIDKLRINHYWTRDEDFFFERKIVRRNKPDSNFQDFLEDFDILNEYEDTAILRFASPLREKMKFDVD